MKTKILKDVYTEAELASSMTSCWAGRNLVFFKETDSTNIQLRRLAEAGVPEGTLAVACQQTAGKGRRGRSWVSSDGDGIWMSLLLRPGFAPERASMLTLVAALAVEQAIKQVTGFSCQIKWPNDLVADGKKICGILTEMSTEGQDIRYVVIGIGINTGMKEFPREIRETATSLELCLGRPVRRSELVNGVMCAWEEFYGQFLKNCDLSILRDAYDCRLVNRNRSVKVLLPGNEYTGMARGIDDVGQLLVEMEDGQVRTVMSGEVSVRGVYGYV